MNPVPHSPGLKLNVSEADNALDLDLLLSVAPYFRVNAATAAKEIARFRSIVSQWRKLANHFQISTREQNAMADAFRLSSP